MAKVFTIFCHGTSSHRTRTDNEIITEFGKLATGLEYRDFLILDGPGSAGGDGGSVVDAENPLPGTFDPYTRNKALKSLQALKDAGFNPKMGLRFDLKGQEGSKVFIGPKFMSMHKSSNLEGLLSGSGWDDNVIHAIATISELNPLPERINMIGWSRGAVICTKMAFLVHKIYPRIEFNIFAIDPVAGTGNRANKDTSTIKENVRNYLAILMKHEFRKIMQPQDMDRVEISKMTNTIFLPFPGIHSTPVRYASKDGETAQIVWSLAYSFLTHFGTQFSTFPSPKYSGQEICNLYGKMVASKNRGNVLQKTWIQKKGPLLKTRNFAENIDKYVVEADYFINEHHRETFIRTYPKCYAFLFKGRKENERGIWLEFKSMYNLLGLMESLSIFGVEKPKPGHPFVLPPPGIGKSRGGINQMGVRGSLLSMGVF
jgi:hypothetical protein